MLILKLSNRTGRYETTYNGLTATPAKIKYILYDFKKNVENYLFYQPKIEKMTKPTTSKRSKLTKATIVATVSASIIYGSYSRTDYKHWIDADKDCQDTRQEVLIIESLEKPILDQKGCRVVKGKWRDPYTDKYFTNPNDLDVDHFVSLKEVDRSGGSKWDKEKKMQYANDLTNPETLIAVDKSANRSKADKDPSD